MKAFSNLKDSVISVFHLNSNFSIYTIEDWNHPILFKVYSHFWEGALIFTTIFFILMLYTIIYKSSKEMDGYKWYLCHQLCWSYIFDLYMGLWKPIPLWPFHLGYSAGIFSNFSSQKFYNLPFGVLIFIASAMGISIFLSLCHRYIQASPFSKMFNLYNNLYLRFGFTIYIFIMIPSILCCPLFLSNFDKEILQKSSVSQNSNISYFFEKEPSIFGFDNVLSENWIIIFLAGYIFTCFCVIVLIILMYFNFLRILFKNKIHLSPGTFVLQKQLFKTLYIQMIFVLILLVIPLMASLTLAIFGVKWVSQFSLISFMLTSLHPLADFAVMIYFIKPYRIFIFGLHKNILKKFGFNFEKAVVQPMVFSTTVSSGDTQR